MPPKMSAAVESFLSAPLLAEVDADARLALLLATEESRAPANTILMPQGKPNDRLWFLTEGTAVIERMQDKRRSLLIATLNAPAIFGTTSFFRPNAPTVAIRSVTEVGLLSLTHQAHDRLRSENPRAAEALALAAVRVLAERFDLIDQRMTEYVAQHPDDQAKVNEWANFRARLFQDSGMG